MTQPHKRKPLQWTDVPKAEQERLKERERSNRARARSKGLPARPIIVEALWMLQRGCCTCNKCRGAVALNPFAASGDSDQTIIAHFEYLAGQGSPGHVERNVALWLKRCNSREAGPETTAFHKGHRFAVNKPVVFDEIEKPKPKKSWPAREMRSAGFPTKKERKALKEKYGR